MAIATLMLAGAGNASAVSCGTVAAPTACSVIASGSVTFTASNFSFVAANGSGGGHTYQAADIAIDIGTGGGLTGLLSFSKNASGPTPGIVFLANPGEAASFTFSYDLTISPAVPGVVAYTGSVISSFSDTHANNGLASFQTVLPGAPTCLVFTGTPSANCALPPGAGTVLAVGDIVTLTGNSGNTSIVSFQSLFEADFTAAPQADLSLTKSDGGATVAPGNTVVYTLTYGNGGGVDATGVALTETVPANASFDAGASTAGWSCSPDGNAGATCTLAVGTVTAGGGPQDATFAVTVDAPLPPGVSQIANSASIAADRQSGVDPTPADNTGSDTTPVTGGTPVGAVPALSTLGLLTLGTLLAGAAWLVLRRAPAGG